jgi:hypothetical protein
MKRVLLALSLVLAFTTANAQHECFICSKDRLQQCLSHQFSGTCTQCFVSSGICTNGSGTCLNICMSQTPTSAGTMARLQQSGEQERAARTTAVATIRHPWLFDSSLSDQISAYSASFARIVKGHQVLFTGERKSSIPDHGTGTFFATDDPNEQAGTFEFFRSGQHWLYTIDKPLDPATGTTEESPNQLELTASAWALYRDDTKKRVKVAEGEILDQK